MGCAHPKSGVLPKPNRILQPTILYYFKHLVNEGATYISRGTDLKGFRSYTMRQRRICEYLGLPCTHFRTFLCLSPAIRYRIYVEAGLFDDSDLRLDGYSDNHIWHPADDLENCRNLLLTCRTVYTEVSRCLYSSNRFLIRYQELNGLQVLRNLRPNSLASLAHLIVDLNATSCPPGTLHDDTHPWWGQNRSDRDRPLRASSYRGRALLSEWQTTFKYIATHLTISQLRFHLVCDVQDFETARQVVKPLTDTPLLADCAIRLAQKPDSSIQLLARETAIRATGYLQDRSTSTFHFLDLPPELRQKILEYTDLVTPLREVEWNPQNGYYLRYSTRRCYDGWQCPSGTHHACQFRECWQSSTTGCFCCRYHSAFSSKCHCWSPPTNLLLVCRALREHAQAIFFTSNRFVITPSMGCHRRAKSTPARLEVSAFLSSVVPLTALYFLRFLEVVIPPFDEYYLLSHEPAYQEWLQTIDHVKEKLNLPLLTVRIYMAEYKKSSNSGPRPFHARMTHERRSTLVKTYARIVGPLSKLRGLKKCFVHIAWPFDWTAAGRRLRYIDPESQRRGVKAIEHKLEQRVLGSDYDSISLGKSELPRSQWLESSMSADGADQYSENDYLYRDHP